MFEPSDKLLLSNIEIFTTIFAAIWQRIPIIFLTQSEQDNVTLLETIFTFFPEHRQLIIVGDISNKIFYRFRTAKMINSSGPCYRNEPILNCFSEDGIVSPPIQLLYINARENDFTETLQAVQSGWVATTALPQKKITALFKSGKCDCITLSDVVLIFPKGRPTETHLERQVAQKCLNRSSSITQFIVQMKMGEVRFVCKAIIQEIEKGNRVNQVETEDQFSINRLTFNQALRLIEVENHFNPMPYIETASAPVSQVLHEIIQHSRILTAAAIKNKNVIALERKKNNSNLSSDLFVPFASFLQESETKNLIGQEIALTIKMENEIKLHYTMKFFPPYAEYICFAFSLAGNIQIAFLDSKLEEIINKMR